MWNGFVAMALPKQERKKKFAIGLWQCHCRNRGEKNLWQCHCRKWEEKKKGYEICERVKKKKL